MKVKGMTYKGREVSLREELGAERWDAFVRDAAKRYAFLREPILPTSLIPAEEFLAFNDEIIAKFFRGDPHTYWMFGEKSADWAFVSGPYHVFVAHKNLARFVDTLPKIWASYFTDGRAVVEVKGPDTFHLGIVDVDVQHIYFEYLVMGFISRGLHHAGAPQVRHQVLKGFSKNDAEVWYSFQTS